MLLGVEHPDYTRFPENLSDRSGDAVGLGIIDKSGWNTWRCGDAAFVFAVLRSGQPADADLRAHAVSGLIPHEWNRGRVRLWR